MGGGELHLLSFDIFAHMKGDPIPHIVEDLGGHFREALGLLGNLGGVLQPPPLVHLAHIRGAKVFYLVHRVFDHVFGVLILGYPSPGLLIRHSPTSFVAVLFLEGPDKHLARLGQRLFQ